MSLTLIRNGVYPCVYCGVTATTVDHVPPVLYKYMMLPSERFSVPACMECNCTLGAKKLFTVLDRQIWLRLTYRRKYASILSRPNVSTSGLEYNLKTMIEGDQEQKELILARLSFDNKELSDLRFPYYATTRSSLDGSLILEAAGGLPGGESEDGRDPFAELLQNDPWINGKTYTKVGEPW